MPQITAWQCPRTRLLFDDYDAYREHLFEIAYANRAKLKKRSIHEAAVRQKEMQTAFRRCASLEDIEWFIGDNLKELVGLAPKNIADYGIFCRPPYVTSNGRVVGSGLDWRVKCVRQKKPGGDEDEEEWVPGYRFNLTFHSDDLDLHGVGNHGTWHTRMGIRMYGNDFVEMYDNVIRMLGIENPSSRLLTNADTNTVTFNCQASVVKLPLMRMREILESEDDLSQERGRVSY